jgi:hypothetical protein
MSGAPEAGHCLRQQDAEHILLRVNSEARAGGAGDGGRSYKPSVDQTVAKSRGVAH